MSVQLAEVARQESEREAKREREREANRYLAPTLPACAYMLTGSELARECELAVSFHPLARSLKLVRSREQSGPVAYSKRNPRKSSDAATRPALMLTDEGSALAAMVAERVYRRKSLAGKRARPADVLAYIARVERFPTLYASGSEVPRSRVGRKYLRSVVTGLLAESREWRDTAESYRNATTRQRDTGPMVESIDATDNPDGLLTAALAREVERSTGEPLAALPLDTERVSEAMALALMTDGAPLDACRVALRMAAGVPLASIARAEGRSLRTIAGRSAAGAAWLRANVAPGQLVALMRSAADATGDVIPADERSPMLPASARSAADAIDRAAQSLTFLPGPTPGRVDGASTRDLRTIAGSAAVAPLTDPDPLPSGPDAAPFPAATAWRVAVARLTAAGHAWPNLAAANER